MGEQFSACKTTWTHLEFLSAAVEASKSHIKALFLPKIDLPVIKSNGALENLFCSLSTLSFNMEDVDFMLKETNNRATTLTSLIRCASQTLHTLEFRNLTTSHPQLPHMEEHFLENIFVKPMSVDSTEPKTLVFPKLRTLKLRSLILNTPSLIAFLAKQPSLEYAHFDYVYLATIGYKWNDVTDTLPPSCKRVYIGKCGHEKCGPDLAVAYNYIKAFYPYKEIFPTTAKWKLNESYFEKEMEDRRLQEIACGAHSLPVEHKYQGMSREEWVAMIRLATDHAEYQRV